VGVGELAIAFCTVGDTCAGGLGVNVGDLVDWKDMIGVRVARGVAVWVAVGVGSRFVAVGVGGSGVVVGVGGTWLAVGVLVAVAVGSVLSGALVGVGVTSDGAVGVRVGAGETVARGRQPVSEISNNTKMENKMTWIETADSVAMSRAFGDFMVSLLFSGGLMRE
jgi:hypothetical protein